MAAPSGIVWGDIVTGSGSGNYHKGRIGVYVSATSTDTTTSVNVQVWFWTIYSCADSYNTLYFDVGTNISSATTSAGSVSINHTVESGSGWSTSNQTRLLNKTYSYSRGTSAVTYKVYAKYSGIDMITNPGTMYANTTFTVPALATYTVSYNANGGSGAPSSQTKYHNKTLTLSSTKPTRSGYTFLGWATSSSATTATYSAGGSYTINASRTLYAVWQAGGYTVSYNANGGTGAPASQTKTHGVALTLSSTIPTRTNYKFLGWATSSSATTATYSAGGSYTSNASITLYAVWSVAYIAPRITYLRVSRATSSGVANDYGTYVNVTLKWESDESSVTVTTYSKTSTSSSWTTKNTATSQPASGEKTVLISSFSINTSYDIKVVVSDGTGSSNRTASLNSGKFIIDALVGGGGIAFGKAAEMEDGAEFNFDIYAGQNIYDKYSTLVGNGCATTAATTLDDDFNNPNTTLEHVILSNTNTPTANYWYVMTYFASTKSSSGNRTQIAYPYTSGIANYGSPGVTYRRYYYNSTWSSWINMGIDAYPIGAIYIAYTHTSPAEILGGTWVRIENRFLWGCTSSGTIGSTGGAQTHTLTVNEMPSHTHNQYVTVSSGGSLAANCDYDSYVSGSAKAALQGVSTGANGSGSAFSIMPPYIYVSIWRRTA